MSSLVCMRGQYFEYILKSAVFKCQKVMRRLKTTTDNETRRELDLNERIYSYLYISPRFANIVYNVLQPKYDLKFLHKTIDSLPDIQHNYHRRDLTLDTDIKQMIGPLNQLIDLKTQLEPKLQLKHNLMNKIEKKKRKKKTITDELIHEYKDICEQIRGLNEKVFDLEEIVMPFVLNIPNDISEDTTQDVQLVDDFKPKRQPLAKYLNYIQLSYINKCLYKSIVGPKSCYLMGISAQLNDSLIEHFSQTLRQNQFIDISGIDFVKTAVVESTHYQDLSDFKSDKLQIKAKPNQSVNDKFNHSLHFVGNSSFESICAIISKRDFNWTEPHIKLLSIGQQFDQNLDQNNSLNAMILTKEDIELSNNQMKSLYQLLWNCFIQLDLKCRAIRSSVYQLERSQYSGIDIEVWLQSQNQWLSASQITQYNDYVSDRLGAPDCHLINASINLMPIIIAIIEQNQTIDATIEIPDCLKQFII